MTVPCSETFTTPSPVGQLMGEAASTVQSRLRDRLAEALPAFAWTTEYSVGSTPVDVCGEGVDDDGEGGAGADTLVLVELEWRRADSADNTAKLFRHLVEGTISHDRVLVFQVFTAYYDLVTGSASSKRKNAEFVGDGSLTPSTASPTMP